MRNWKILGETEKAASAKRWFISSLIMLIVFSFMRESATPQNINLDLAILSYLIFLLSWYFLSGREQSKYVNESGLNCIQKSFSITFKLGFAAFFSFFWVALSEVAAYAVKTLK